MRTQATEIEILFISFIDEKTPVEDLFNSSYYIRLNTKIGTRTSTGKALISLIIFQIFHPYES